MSPAPRNLLFALAVVAALIGEALIPSLGVERGWLTGFLIWSSAPVGAVVLALIHATTGGRWAQAAAPTLPATAACAALAPFAFAPLLFGLARVYPWAAHADAAAADVARLYLNPAGFAARGLLALVGWAVIGLFVSAGRLSLLGAALALVFHGVAVSLVAVDWGLSVDPHYSDSAFGAELAVQQLTLALAVIAVVQPQQAGGDIGGLLLAASLGAFYLGLMTYIVKWYGDQPADAAWTLARTHGLGLVWLLGAVIFGAVAPIAALSWRRVRGTPKWLRLAGACAALGIASHDLWWMAVSGWAALAALLAVVALTGVSALFCGAATALRPRRIAHGG